MSESKHELFHRISDLESAAVRRMINELQLKSEIDFRNVDSSDEAAADLRRHQGEKIPALWTGEELITGREEIEKYLKWVTEEPFPELAKNFDRITSEVWSDLQKLIPDEFKQYIDRLQFWIFDEPTPDILEQLPKDLASHPDELCGLHVGIPLTEESVVWPESEPVRVYLFRWAHLDLLTTEDTDPERILREEIATTLLHEIGHYFGLSEEDLDRLGYG